MARSREQVIQDQLGAMALQLAVLTADLEAAREELAALKDAKPSETAETVR